MLLILASFAHASTCAAPSHAADIAAKLAAAEKAYATFDVDAFSSSLDEAALMLPCVDDKIDPMLSASYHRMLGLRWYIERDSAKADQAFAAARSVDPTYSFPETLIPAGHSVRTHYTAIDPSTAPTETMGAPLAGQVLLDGNPTVVRHTTLPTVAQVIDKDAHVAATRYLLPGDAMLPYPAAAAPKSESLATARPLNPKIPIAIGAGVAAIASATLYVMATNAEEKFNTYDANITMKELEAERSQTNGLVLGSVGAGVLAVAGGVGTVIVGKW